MVGSKLLTLTDRQNPYLALVVGVVIVAVLALIPILVIIVRAIVTLFGGGAVAIGLSVAYPTVREHRSIGPA